MKTLYSIGLAALLLTGAARASGEKCESNSDCGKGEACIIPPCLPPQCDPATPDCEVPECPATCVVIDEGTDGGTDGGGSDGGSDGGSSNNGCETDADCGDGFKCDVIGSMGTGCACPEGAEDCGCSEPAEPTEFKGCVPKPCETDADCAEGLECATFDVPCAVTQMACADESNCPEPEPCDSGKYSQCQPKWAGTCDADADCGEGFTCKAYEVCACSGGVGGTEPASPDGGEAPASGGSDEPGNGGAPLPDGEDTSDAADPPEECTCAPSDEKYCEPVEQECTTDADCPTDWKCESFGSTSVSGGGSATGTSTDADAGPACPEGSNCAGAEEGSSDPAGSPVAPPEEKLLCTPPYYTQYAEAGALPANGPMQDGESFATKAQDSNGGDGGDGADGAPVDAGGDDGGAATGGGNGGDKASSAGCAVEPTSQGAGAAGLLALLAGFVLVSRRRVAARAPAKA